MYQFDMRLAFVLLFVCTHGIATLKMIGITGPAEAQRGSEITLTCDYNEEYSMVYAVNWFFEHQEFFRFVPMDTRKYQAFQTRGLTVNLQKSHNNSVTISNITFAAAGTYTCQVSLEAPTFATEQIKKEIRVLETPIISMGLQCRQDYDHFRPDTTYLFKYVVDATTNAPMTTKETSGFFISCDVEVDAYGECQYSLNVNSCGIKTYKDGHEHPKSSKFSTVISSHRVQFSMSNGTIGGLLSHKDEPLNLLNFKRGIISALLTKSYQSQDNTNTLSEMRTDVHGTCLVTYIKGTDTWQLEKYMSECHFPPRLEWPYSPMSIIWNTSNIHSPVIDSKVECEYKFFSQGNLEMTKCVEHQDVRVRSKDHSLIPVQQHIVTQLSYHDSRKLTPSNLDYAQHYFTRIQYEYQRVTKPTQNPEHFKDKVLKLLDDLPTDPEKTMDPETANEFDRLVDMLRKSPEFSGTIPLKCWDSPDCTDMDIKNAEIQKGQIWMTALIQCNTAPCTKAFLTLLQSNPKYVAHVISKTDLHSISLAWAAAKIDDIEQIQHILEIAKSRPEDRFLLTTLASIIHDYWDRHQTVFRSNIPSPLREFVQLIVKPIGKNCTLASGYKYTDLKAAMQAITNLGPLFQMLHPIYVHTLETCLTNENVHWSTSFLAIQATSRMKQTKELYDFLLKVLKTPVLKHEDHAAAYLILTKKFGGNELLAEILKVLEKIQKDGQNNNLRTLIVTHLRTISKAWDPDRLPFVNVIRTAMVEKPYLFRAIPEDNEYELQADDRKLKEIPWDINIDEDLKFEEGYFSKYDEMSYKFIPIICPDILKIIGLKLSQTSLHNEHSFLAYATWLENHAHILGENFKGNHISVTTKGVMDLVQKMVSYSGSGKINMAALRSVYQNAPNFFNKAKTSWQRVQRVSKDDFPYKIDEAILQSLANFHNEHIQQNLNKSTERDVLFQYGSSTPLTMEDLNKARHGYLHDLLEKLFSPYKTKSNYWKAIEAATEFPTLAGLPLKWTTNAYLINNLKLDTSIINDNESRGLKINGSFSGIGTLKQGIHLDLPEFASCGAEMFTTVSTSFGADLSASWNPPKRNVQIHLELPQRSMQLFGFKRTISLKDKYPSTKNPEVLDLRVNESWCSYTLASLTGFKICHSRSFVNQTCPLLAGDSDWNYTADYVAKHKVAFQLAAKVKKDMDMDTYEMEMKSRDITNPSKFNTMIKLLHKKNSTKKEFKTELMSPIVPSFHLKANKQSLKNDGVHFKADVTIYPGKTTHIEYSENIMVERMTESDMGSKLVAKPSSTPTDVRISDEIFNYTSPNAVYIFHHKSHKFTRTTYFNTAFRYKRLEANQESWVRAVLHQEMFWDNKDSANIEIRHHVKHPDMAPRGFFPEESHTTIVLPKKIYTLTTFKGTVPSLESTENSASIFNINMSESDPSTHEVLDYFNFTTTQMNTRSVDVETTVLDVNLTVPMFSCGISISKSRDHNRPNGKNFTIILKRAILKSRPGNTDMESQRWWSSSIQLKFGSKDLYNPNWITCENCTKSSTYMDIATREFSADFLYQPDDYETRTFEINLLSTPTYVSDTYDIIHKRDIAISIPSEGVAFDGKFHFESTAGSGILLWTAVMNMPLDQRIEYSFNITPVITEFGLEKFYVTEYLLSNTYKRISRLVTNYTASTTTINITATCPTEPMLEVDLQLNVYADKKLALKVRHFLADIDGDATWRNGYTHDLRVKSKDQAFVSSLKWNVNSSQDDNGVKMELQLHNTDVFYTYARTELNAKRLVVDTCYHANCTFNPYSENFVAQMEWSLENPTELSRTMVYNPTFKYSIEQNIAQRFSMMNLALREYLRTASKESPILQWKYGISSILFDIRQDMVDFINPFSLLEKYFRTDFVRGTSHRRQFGTRDCWTQLFDSDVLHPSLQRRGTSLISNVGHAIYQHVMLQWYKPGPEPDRSYVTTISLPVYWTQFNKYPLQYSPSFIRGLNSFKEASYYEEKYTRQALLVGTDDIYTFDGKVLHLQQRLPRQCAFLLIHDIDELKFSVYYYDTKIHFIFPELSLSLGQTGQVVLNHTTRADLPLESWNRNIRITRQNYLIEVATPYNFKVICNVEDFFCLFYTNGFKFNHVIGLLGNNNDDPSDDSKDPIQFELSGTASCRNSKFLYPSQSTNGSTFPFRWHNLVWSNTSPTLPCHDVISIKDFFVPAYIEDPSHFPCNLMNGYLALCEAKGIKGDPSPCSK